MLPDAPACALHGRHKFYTQWRSTAAPRATLRVVCLVRHAGPVYIDDNITVTFTEWAKSVGIYFAKLKPAEFQRLRGMGAVSDIKMDDVVLSVPRAAAITLAPKQKCPCINLVNQQYWDTSPWFVKMAVLLLHEKRQGSSSKLYTYIQQLPKTIESPVNWSEERVQYLQYPYLIHKVLLR